MKTAIFTYGRFQPPTKGHKELIMWLQKQAEFWKKSGENVSTFLFTSQKDNDFENPRGDFEKLRQARVAKAAASIKKKTGNPLKIEKKLEFLNFYFGDLGITIVDVEKENIKTIPQAATWLERQGYDRIIFFVGREPGEDMGEERDRGGLLKKNKDLFFLATSNRDEEKISATKVREAAIKGDFDTLYELLGGDNACIERPSPMPVAECKEKAKEIMKLIKEDNDFSIGGRRRRTRGKRRRKRRRRTHKKRRRRKRRTRRRVRRPRRIPR